MLKNDVEKAVLFLKEIKKKKVVVVSHDDSDGSCSATLMIRLLKKVGTNNQILNFSTRGSPSISDELMKDILSEKPDVVITCDFAGSLDKSAHVFDGDGIRCLMIDHHVVQDYKFPEGCVYLNPQLDGKTMPCSAFIYDLCMKMTDFEENLWIAAVGTIEDFGAAEREDIIRACMKKYPELFEKKDIDNRKLFDTTFGLVGKIIGSAPSWASYHGAELATKVLLEIDSPRDFLDLANKDVKTLYEKYEMINIDVKKTVRQFDEKNEKDGRVRILVMSSEYPIKSKVSTIISAKDEYYKDVIMVAEENTKSVSISLRNQSGDFDLDSIIRESLSGLEGTGGGHKKAAGTVVSKKDFDVFMERFKGKVNG
ncbi:MAG: DHH family phosphoesterase [Candidatus Aenigmarchaeota archaeon]|nr:DHH family phosphoesterase [Candidatus Aenigmarchaeota archaeon]